MRSEIRRGGGDFTVILLFGLFLALTFAPAPIRAADTEPDSSSQVSAFFTPLLEVVSKVGTDIGSAVGNITEAARQIVASLFQPPQPEGQGSTITVSTTIPPPLEERPRYTVATSSAGAPVYTTVIERHDTYITNPTTVIRESSGGGGNSDGVSRDLFRRQIDVVLDNIGESINSLQDDFGEAVETVALMVSGNASVGGNLDVVGTLTAGLLSVSGVSSGSVVEAPYFTATSSTASTFPYASTTAISSHYASSTNGFFGNLSIGSLSGILKAATGAISAGSVNLATEVSGVLPVANGGTGASSLNDLITLGTHTTGSYVSTITGSSQIGVSGVGAETATAVLSINADSIGDSQLTFDTGQHLTTVSAPTFAGLTLTNSTSTNATSTNLFTSLARATNSVVDTLLTVSGSLGVGTTSPFRKLSVADTVANPQFALAYDGTRYSQFQTDAAGDLSILTTGGNTRLPDNNLFVCSGGACPTLSISGTGNLVIENKLTVGSLEQFCPTGYVWVPGEARYGTLPGFCTMKYEAKNSGGTPVSVPAGTPYVSISQTSARAACEALGIGYHLISEPEWMTIADQIATLPINDLDADAALQLATGHSDNAPANALDAGTSATDPVVSGCDLMQNLEASANAYAAGVCELRGTGSGGSTDNDKGYYGTGQQWSATGYSAGTANKSQLRTHVLPNGQVLWDIAGDVYDWTDAYLWSASLVGAASSTVSEMPDAGSWTTANWYQYTAITNYKALSYARPKLSTWSSTNGIGQIYLPLDSGTYRAFRRGASWNNGSDAGVFTLNLYNAPSDTVTNVGFRCSRSP